ncbi:YoaK family protein [Kitasatospora cinereorecta]|uniref:YoaK family protein n=1 Tax=Kitasatospora cinereorecta TaxID=285560 RepID=A0ABW0V6K6_9ACTN
MDGPQRGRLRIEIVLTVLTVTTGAVDALTFLGLGRAFAALATGNVLLLSFAVAGEPDTPVARPAFALLAFVLGAAAAYRLITVLAERGRRWFALAMVVEATLVGAAGIYCVAVAGTADPTADEALVVIVLVALAMGWRNRVGLEAGVPDMPTTVVQMALVKLAVDVLPFRTAEPAAPVDARLRRLGTVAGMFIGGCLGALLLVLGIGVGPGLIGVAACAAVVALGSARDPRLQPLAR